jgi:hypothetical protein
MRRSLTTLLTVLMLFVLAVPAGSATEWKTRATVSSKGVGSWETATSVRLSVNDPYAVRVGFRTTNDKAHTVTYTYQVLCDNQSSTVRDKTVKTNADNTWVNVNVFTSGGLGNHCVVQVFSDLASTARLHTRVQIKNP